MAWMPTMAASELVPGALISGGRRKRIDAARTTSQGTLGRQALHRPRGGGSLGAGGAFTGAMYQKKPPERGARAAFRTSSRTSKHAGQDVYHSTRDMEGSPNSPVAHPSARVRNRGW